MMEVAAIRAACTDLFLFETSNFALINNGMGTFACRSRQIKQAVPRAYGNRTVER